MEKRRKLVAAAMAVLLLLAVLSFYPIVAKNAHHDCTGEHCPICMEMEAIARTVSELRQLPVLQAVLLVLFVFTQILGWRWHSDCLRDTLITWKVELLN